MTITPNTITTGDGSVGFDATSCECRDSSPQPVALLASMVSGMGCGVAKDEFIVHRQRLRSCEVRFYMMIGEDEETNEKPDRLAVFAFLIDGANSRAGGIHV